jgi:symplekin
VIDIDEALRLSDYRIPPPPDVDDEQRSVLIRTSFSRVWNNRAELAPAGDSLPHEPGCGASPQDLPMLLLIRMATRIARPQNVQDEDEQRTEAKQTDVDMVSKQERIRQTLFDYVMTDFQSRYVNYSSQTL